MNETTSWDVLVVGAGPAGLAAACSAAEQGQRVAVLDDNPDVGGQIWRGEKRKPKSRIAGRWLRRIASSSVTTFRGTTVVDQIPGGLKVIREGKCHSLKYQHLILATGARERFLPFPGWTLPGVMGAGGLQAMVKSGMPIERRRVILAGSGPLLLAVADYLKAQGAHVLCILEQADWWNVTKFGLSLMRSPGKLLQALQLQFSLRGVPWLRGRWPLRAEGRSAVQAVTFTDGKTTWTRECDYLACGFGLIPNLELAKLLGCQVQSGVVQVDELQRSSVERVLCAGEITGIGGLDLSLLEGQIAGMVAAGKAEEANRWFAKRNHARRFATRLEGAFALREELQQLPTEDTLICRCEDVSWRQIRHYGSWREAKLQTRCGMGPCQGRICGAISEYLLDWQVESIRPPLFPVPLDALQSEE